MEDLLWKVGSMAVVAGFIALIIYLNHRDTVKGKQKEPVEYTDVLVYSDGTPV